MLTCCKLMLLLVFHWIFPQNNCSLLRDFGSVQVYKHGKIQPCLGGVIVTQFLTCFSSSPAARSMYVTTRATEEGCQVLGRN